MTTLREQMNVDNERASISEKANFDKLYLLEYLALETEADILQSIYNSNSVYFSYMIINEEKQTFSLYLFVDSTIMTTEQLIWWINYHTDASFGDWCYTESSCQ